MQSIRHQAKPGHVPGFVFSRRDDILIAIANPGDHR